MSPPLNFATLGTNGYRIPFVLSVSQRVKHVLPAALAQAQVSLPKDRSMNGSIHKRSRKLFCPYGSLRRTRITTILVEWLNGEGSAGGVFTIVCG